MSYYGEKPKNDSYKPKHDYYSEPERGGCLTLFLVVLGIGQIGLLLYSFSMLDTISSLSANPSYYGNLSTARFLFWVQVAMSLAMIVSIYGLWNWKTWGYGGMAVIYAINLLMSLFTGQLTMIFGAVLGATIFFILTKDKRNYLN